MKDNWDNISNNDILLEIQQMRYIHEELKQHLLIKFDELVAIEKRYDEANLVIYNRLTGTNLSAEEYKIKKEKEISEDYYVSKSKI